MNPIPYTVDNLGTFQQEWGTHQQCSEWWYATGVLFDDAKNLYSYQYTVLSMFRGPYSPKIAMLALTDYKNNRHYYLQCPAAPEVPVTISENEISIAGMASAVKHEDHMTIQLKHKDFTLDVKAGYGKGAFWHCNNGKLYMGTEEEDETTLYYSYTNMPTEAQLVLNGETIHLTGKTWFDKQGGIYGRKRNLNDHWEWFSLRFFDDEEVMLFTFPRTGYVDGTYITAEGTSARMNQYEIRQTATVEDRGLIWSAGWEVKMPVKEQEYTIEPIQHGHINFAYFEELCYIKNRAGQIVGYAFAELLPAVHNRPDQINIDNLFARVEV